MARNIPNIQPVPEVRAKNETALLVAPLQRGNSDIFECAFLFTGFHELYFIFCTANTQNFSWYLCLLGNRVLHVLEVTEIVAIDGYKDSELSIKTLYRFCSIIEVLPLSSREKDYFTSFWVFIHLFSIDTFDILYFVLLS